uniref:Uncharacterized protein n=1 Tax=Rhizophora mucronata TaxID=61149 RepID=A0A2P2LBY8_RHIMU
MINVFSSSLVLPNVPVILKIILKGRHSCLIIVVVEMIYFDS